METETAVCKSPQDRPSRADGRSRDKAKQEVMQRLFPRSRSYLRYLSSSSALKRQLKAEKKAKEKAEKQQLTAAPVEPVVNEVWHQREKNGAKNHFDRSRRLQRPLMMSPLTQTYVPIPVLVSPFPYLCPPSHA